VNVIGILTWETVPGLNRHCRNALRAELSSIGLPVLCVMEAPVTLPLAASTVATQTPLPVMRFERASYGYPGRGEFMARAFARDIDIDWALIGVNFCCAAGGGRGGGVLSSTNSGLISGGGGGSGSGISSGGGVASGGANVASTTVGALGGISTGGASRL
jgi:uncharacterized membrane protein YgcG